MSLIAAFNSFLGRHRDRRMERPPGLAYWLDGKPKYSVAFGLALQHLAIQSIYFVLPTAAAATVTNDPLLIGRFLSLSILSAALWQVLQLLTRGPVGSGYPVPATHTAATLAAVALAGRAGAGFAGVGAMATLTGLVAIVLTFLMRRLRVVLPNEIAGVVVILIGVSLIGLASVQLGLQPGETPGDENAILIVLGSMTVMMVVALSKTKATPFAVLIGAVCGVVPAVLLGEAPANALATLAARPWFALPQPWVPDFTEVSVGPLAAFLLSLVALKATATGSLVVIQRAADSAWTRPDAPPLRRGLVANGLAITLGGLIGGAVPGPATAAVGLSVATGTLARRIVWCGVPLLVIVALCPKLVAAFVLTPASVKAAMLLYVAGFIMAQGCQLATARLLDTRRTLIVALGLGAGIIVAIAPLQFQAKIPFLASPLSFGAVVAFVVNALTLPLVGQRAARVLALQGRASREADEWIGSVAGAWGLKQQTLQYARYTLDELIGIFTARGLAEVRLSLLRAEDRIELNLSWEGDLLPNPAERPDFEDLLGPLTAQEGFAVWLATRSAQSFSQSRSPQGCSAWLVFED